jgi:type IV pilus assembly protein PilV
MNAIDKNTGRGAAGFTLIEVMVAMLVLGMGLIGLVGLQVVSLKVNQAALSRSIASEYAYAMIDKIRSDGWHMPSYMVATMQPADGLSGSSLSDDVKLWGRKLARALPGARVQICGHDGGAAVADCNGVGDYVVVRVAWQQGKDAKLLFDADAPSTNAQGAVHSQSIEVMGRI